MRRSLTAGAVIAAAMAAAGVASAQTYTAPPPGPPASAPTVIVPPAPTISRDLRPSLQAPQNDELHPSAPANINCIPSNVPSTGSMAPQLSNEPCH